jgi:TonB family protein
MGSILLAQFACRESPPKLRLIRVFEGGFDSAQSFDRVTEGVVIVEAKIDMMGRVTEARILRSIPLLDQSALDAVREWEFEPVVIEGIGRVPIIAALSVSFKLP